MESYIGLACVLLTFLYFIGNFHIIYFCSVPDRYFLCLFYLLITSYCFGLLWLLLFFCYRVYNRHLPQEDHPVMIANKKNGRAPAF